MPSFRCWLKVIFSVIVLAKPNLERFVSIGFKDKTRQDFTMIKRKIT